MGFFDDLQAKVQARFGPLLIDISKSPGRPEESSVDNKKARRGQLLAELHDLNHEIEEEEKRGHDEG